MDPIVLYVAASYLLMVPVCRWYVRTAGDTVEDPDITAFLAWLFAPLTLPICVVLAALAGALALLYRLVLGAPAARRPPP